jgi:hypothetical protein
MVTLPTYDSWIFPKKQVETLCEYLERFDVVTAVSFDV